MINASAETIWKILTEVKDYPDWNPFITSFEGDLVEGARLKVKMQPPESKAMVFKPMCLSCKTNKELVWSGQLLLPGIFDGKHIFELNAIGKQETKFVQREEFSGLLVPFLWKQLDNNTRRGFELMNQKLKEKSEKQ